MEIVFWVIVTLLYIFDAWVIYDFINKRVINRRWPMTGRDWTVTFTGLTISYVALIGMMVMTAFLGVWGMFLLIPVIGIPIATGVYIVLHDKPAPVPDTVPRDWANNNHP